METGRAREREREREREGGGGERRRKREGKRQSNRARGRVRGGGGGEKAKGEGEGGRGRKKKREITGGVAVASRRRRVASASLGAGNEREAYVAAARNGVWGRFQRPGRKSRGKREAIPFPAERTFEWCARRRLRASGPTGGSGSPVRLVRTRPGQTSRPPSSLDPPRTRCALQWRSPAYPPIQNAIAFLPAGFSSAGWGKRDGESERERERERESCDGAAEGDAIVRRARGGGDTEPKGGRTTPLLKMATCPRTGLSRFYGRLRSTCEDTPDAMTSIERWGGCIERRGGYGTG